MSTPTYKIPKLVRICGRSYEVDSWTPPQGIDSSMNLGLFREIDSKINILGGQSLSSEQNTVLHECIHGLDVTFGLKLKEAQVHHLAYAVLGLFKENPALKKYLLEQ